MQNCFRKYPEVYGSELEGADDDDEPELSGDAATPALANTNSSQSAQSLETPRTPSSHKAQPQRETGAPDKAKMSSEPSSKPAASEKAETESRSLGLVPDNYKPSATKSEEPVSESEEPVSESKDLVPKAAFDAGDENTKVLERK
jgi:intermembrane space import and assembly protein 40